MAITYKSQGSGVATETSGAALSPQCPATVDAGDILIAHVFWEGTTTAPSTPANWTLLHGPEVIETTIARHWVFGKIADGTEDGAAVAFGSPAVTTQRGARIYSFAGRVSGTITDLVRGFSATSHATDPQMPSVTTIGTDSLAVALVAQNDNNTIGNATGESGGDWTEAVAEFTAALTPGLLLQIQTAAMASPGTISGGSVNTANDPVGVIGFEIRDSVPTSIGTLSTTDAADTAVSDVDVLVAATLSKTEDNDALSADADVLISASSSVDGNDDTQSADVDVVVTATLSTADANETLSADGSVQTVSVGNAATTDESESTSADADVLITASFSNTEENESLSSVGSVLVLGTSSKTDADDTNSSDAFHVIDTEVALHGVVSGQAVSSIPDAQLATRTANLSVTEADETLSGSASVVVSADIATQDAGDTLSSEATSGQAQQQNIQIVVRQRRRFEFARPTIYADLNVTEEDDTLIADAFIADSLRMIQSRRRFKVAIAG